MIELLPIRLVSAPVRRRDINRTWLYFPFYWNVRNLTPQIALQMTTYVQNCLRDFFREYIIQRIVGIQASVIDEMDRRFFFSFRTDYEPDYILELFQDIEHMNDIGSIAFPSFYRISGEDGDDVPGSLLSGQVVLKIGVETPLHVDAYSLDQFSCPPSGPLVDESREDEEEDTPDDQQQPDDEPLSSASAETEVDLALQSRRILGDELSILDDEIQRTNEVLLDLRGAKKKKSVTYANVVRETENHLKNLLRARDEILRRIRYVTRTDEPAIILQEFERFDTIEAHRNYLELLNDEIRSLLLNPKPFRNRQRITELEKEILWHENEIARLEP